MVKLASEVTRLSQSNLPLAVAHQQPAYFTDKKYYFLTFSVLCGVLLSLWDR